LCPISVISLIYQTNKKHTFMKNSVRITCTVPTVYQLKSISALSRGNWGKQIDGSYIWEEEFQNLAQAKNFLRERAYQLASDYHELTDMRNEITSYNQLTYDAATAIIESI